MRTQKKSITLFCIIALFLMSTPAWAVPPLITYQGKLTDAQGEPVTATEPMKFRICDAEAGGNILYEESQTVIVQDGNFNVFLGSGTPTIGTFDLTLFSADNRWLEVVVNNEPLIPRQRLTSVAYTFKAGSADSVATPLYLSGSIVAPIIKGTNSSNGDGVRGESNGGGASGVYGQNNSSTGTGVTGVGIGGSGVTGLSTTGNGVFGSSNTGNGVDGMSNGSTKSGVHGENSGSGYGVYGQSVSGFGVTGRSDTGYAGYFAGKAKVTGDLEVGGTLTGPGIGDITAVNAGTGLSGGGQSGDVTLNVSAPLSLSSAGSNPTIKGTNTTGDGLSGKSSSGSGVYGESSTGNGVLGQSSTSNTRAGAVAGFNTGSGYGVYGESSSGYAGYFAGKAKVTGNLEVGGTLTGGGVGDITGVIAGTGLKDGGLSGDVTLNIQVPLSLSSTGSTPTIKGTNTTGIGVGGNSTSGHGVGGTSDTGSGVFGTSISGDGVWGQTHGSLVSGVKGINYSSGTGVYGESSTGDGVWGQTIGSVVSGVKGINWGSGYGVYGESNTGDGVLGQTSGSVVSGVKGINWGSGYGVYGQSNTGDGVWGQTSGSLANGVKGIHYSIGTGVYGESSTGTGVWGQTNGSSRSGVAGVNTGSGAGVYGRSTSGYAGWFDGPVLVGTLSANIVTITSDSRLKKNVSTIPDALNKVSGLRGVEFEWRTENFPWKGLNEGRNLGLIAQEVEKVLPEVVSETKDGYKTVEYANIVAVLIEAVKELKDRNERLQSRIEAIEHILSLPAED